ncbi:GntR family transcriptional regulator, partial [Mycobacterium tuberculosis]|nr:GntR family transcriptional regulator [Mycobacterium tuberculosis]
MAVLLSSLHHVFMLPTDLAGTDGDQSASLPRSERAYQQLRAAIQAGQLPPGTRLREAELAESLG